MSSQGAILGKQSGVVYCLLLIAKRKYTRHIACGVTISDEGFPDFARIKVESGGQGFQKALAVIDMDVVRLQVESCKAIAVLACASEPAPPS